MSLRFLNPIAGVIRKNDWMFRVALMAIPNVQMTIQTPSAGPLVINARQHRRLWLRSPFHGEEYMLGGVRRLARPGDIVYDVGANIGLFVRFIHRGLLPGAIYAFEPMRDNQKILRANIDLDCDELDVTVLPLALSDVDGDEMLQIDDVMSASAALDSVTHGAASEGRQKMHLPPKTEKVSVRRLDTVLARRQMRPPNMIKVDIEGAEGRFLRGAEETIRKYEPHLLIELHGIDTAREVLPILDSYGYVVYSYLRTDHQNGKEVREYRRILPEIVDQLKGKYDLHYLYASTDESLLAEPVELYFPDDDPSFVKRIGPAPAIVRT